MKGWRVQTFWDTARHNAQVKLVVRQKSFVILVCLYLGGVGLESGSYEEKAST